MKKGIKASIVGIVFVLAGLFYQGLHADGIIVASFRFAALGGARKETVGRNDVGDSLGIIVFYVRFVAKKVQRYVKSPEAMVRGQNLLVIENVPAISCPHCGKSYLTAETLHEIERIKRHWQSLAKSRPVPVATFA